MVRLRERGARAAAALSIAVMLSVGGCRVDRDVAAERAAATEEPRDSVSRAPGPDRNAFRAPDPVEPQPAPDSGDDPTSLRARLRIPTEATARAWLQRFGEVVEERAASGD